MGGHWGWGYCVCVCVCEKERESERVGVFCYGWARAWRRHRFVQSDGKGVGAVDEQLVARLEGLGLGPG